MIIYLVMCLISILLVYKYDKSNIIIYYLLAALPFILISGIRYGVGTDYFYRYVTDIQKINLNIPVPDMELGFKLLIKLCLLFSKNYNLFFFITSVIANCIIFYNIKKDSNNKVLSILIYFIAGFFFQSMNMIRQFIAISLIFSSYKWILNFSKKNLIFLVICSIVAFSIHTSSIIAIFILLCLKFIKKPFNYLTLTITIVLLILLSNPIYHLTKLIVSNTRFNVYLVGAYAHGDVSYLNLILNLLIYMYMYFIYSKSKIKNTKLAIFYLNCQSITTLLFALTSNHVLFSRIAYYFSIFQILSIPYFISYFDSYKIKFKDLVIRKKTLYISIIILFGATFTYTNIIHNDNQPLPYRTIFNKGDSNER